MKINWKVSTTMYQIRTISDYKEEQVFLILSFFLHVHKEKLMTETVNRVKVIGMFSGSIGFRCTGGITVFRFSF